MKEHNNRLSNAKHNARLTNEHKREIPEKNENKQSGNTEPPNRKHDEEVSGEGYKIPSVFLNDTEDGVKKVVDSMSEPKKVYTILKCVLVKHTLKTGEKIYADFNGKAKLT